VSHAAPVSPSHVVSCYVSRSSFASWIVANILVCFDVARGSLLLTLTGLMMVGACVIYALCQPSSPLVVRFVDAYLRLHYGWCFWLCLVSGGTLSLSRKHDELGQLQ